MFDKYINLLEVIATQLKDITFFKFFFPLLAVVGSFVFFKYGLRGIKMKHTISLFRFKGFSNAQSRFEYTGLSAQIVGIIYLFSGFFCALLLGGVSYFLILK